jgi:hypothetical protein
MATVRSRHERLHGKYATSALFDHYLKLLARKPGGLEHSVALSQERDRGAWPGCFDELRTALRDRYRRSDAARQMVDVVLDLRERLGGAQARFYLALQLGDCSHLSIGGGVPPAGGPGGECGRWRLRGRA